MNNQIIRNIDRSVEYIRGIANVSPEIGLILGSGLGDYAQSVSDAKYIAYGDIAGFPISTVPGHEGRFVFGDRLGRKVMIMQGRIHCYEGYTQSEVAMPVGIMSRLGVKKLLVTNAAGGVNTNFEPGSLMIIEDHINYSGSSPLIGVDYEGNMARFPDMSNIYTRRLRENLKQKAKSKGIKLESGVYMMFTGPSYETPAEIRMARMLGADAVGMSTVPETIAAAGWGMEVLGISCITNMGAGILDTALNHSDVMETAMKVKEQFIQLVDLIIDQVM